MSLNKVILVGNLGDDPEVKYTSGGNAVANLSLATNERWTDKSGEKQERTEWHKVVVWGRQAEVAGEYMRKGQLVCVEGSLQTRKWEDRDGNNRYTTEVKAFNIHMLGGRGGGPSEQPARSPEPPVFSQEPPVSEDDIPF